MHSSRTITLAPCLAVLLAACPAGFTLGDELPMQPARTVQFATEEGTWLSLDVSPDGKTIVFDMLGDLYAVSSKGGKAKALTSGMAFDTQAVFSPDGKQLAFVSDRSGAENLWLAKPDGSEPRQLTFRDDDRPMSSPEWSADGQSVFAIIHRVDLQAAGLWEFSLDPAIGAREIIPIRTSPEQDRDSWLSVAGPAVSRDGRFVYFAGHNGTAADGAVPKWTIRRHSLEDGTQETLVSAPRSPRPDLSGGAYFRPTLSPDGTKMVYATRFDGQAGLRLLDLESGADEWLLYPAGHDQAMASHWQGILPRFTFMPDGHDLLLSREGRIRRLNLRTGEETPVPFEAEVSLAIGPDLQVPITQETGPVRARLIETPEVSPDGRQLAFTALTRVYLMDLEAGAPPRLLTNSGSPEFNPSWSPDGAHLVYVSWTAKAAGQVWIAPANGKAKPRQLSQTAAFYTSPVFTTDGKAVVVLRSSHSVRMHTFMDYGLLREAELLFLPLDGSAGRVLARGQLGGKPGFLPKQDRVTINASKGVVSIPLQGGEPEPEIQVLGPGWYFAEGPAPADQLKLSPDGRWALAQFAQQLFLVAVPGSGEKTVNLLEPAVPFRKLTDIGADFFDWADGGKTITWAVGSTWYRRPLDGVQLLPANGQEHLVDPPELPDGSLNASAGVERFEAVVEVPRDTPKGELLLTGATALTMSGGWKAGDYRADVIPDADILVVDDRIAAIGPRGSISVMAGVQTLDVSGQFILPGFIDTHDHLAEIRRRVQDLETWSPAASLAYGVTTKFDPSSLSIDMLVYEDLVDAGMITGARIHSTGPALFSFNRFESEQQVKRVLQRYRDHYRTRNIKMYRTGDREVRQWVAMAAREMGMLPTTEGALALKLDLTQIIDGFAGQEHALPAAPLYRDVVQLLAQSGVSYNSTLLITNGGPEAQDWFISSQDWTEDPKLNRFWPRYTVDIKLRQRTWRTLDDYLFPAIAASAAKVMRAGGWIGMGSHGEVPGIGLLWEMQAHVMGGMLPMEVLRAGTLGSARVIGRQAEFGSIEAGKYADLIILDEDPLQDLGNIQSIRRVMKNGRLYEADTLAEIWPRNRPAPEPWFRNDIPPINVRLPAKPRTFTDPRKRAP